MKRKEEQVMSSEVHWKVNNLKVFRRPMTESDVLTFVEEGKNVRSYSSGHHHPVAPT